VKSQKRWGKKPREVVSKQEGMAKKLITRTNKRGCHTRNKKNDEVSGETTEDYQTTGNLRK